MNISNLMKDYFITENSDMNFPFQNKSSDLPIKKKKSKWLKSESSCIRQFKFNSEVAKANFCIRAIKHTFDSSANIEINFTKEFAEVRVISPSGYITEIEKDAIKEINYLYKEITVNNPRKEV